MDKIYAHADFIMQMKLSKLIQIILIYNFGVLRDCFKSLNLSKHSNSRQALTFNEIGTRYFHIFIGCRQHPYMGEDIETFPSSYLLS